MYLGEIIKEYRKKENISANELARRCNLSGAYIGILEKNKNTSGKKPIPTIDVVMAVAKAMRINSDELFLMLDDTQEINISQNKNEYLNTKEKKHIEKYRKLSDSNKKDVDDFIDFRLHKENQNQKKKETHPLLKKLQKEIEEDYFDLNIASADGSNEKRNLTKKEAEELQTKLNRTNEEDKDPFEDMQKKLKEGGFSEKDFK